MPPTHNSPPARTYDEQQQTASEREKAGGGGGGETDIFGGRRGWAVRMKELSLLTRQEGMEAAWAWRRHGGMWREGEQAGVFFEAETRCVSYAGGGSHRTRFLFLGTTASPLLSVAGPPSRPDF